MRTQDEIVSRYNEVKYDDWLGFKAEVLLAALDFEHARQFIKLSATADAWNTPKDEEALRAEAMNYLDFAFGKASDHRGLSASRSVDKLTEYAWLLGRDDVVSAMDDAGYAQYGVPKLFAFASGFDVTDYEDDEELLRMSRGEPCREGCEEGCGS